MILNANGYEPRKYILPLLAVILNQPNNPTRVPAMPKSQSSLRHRTLGRDKSHPNSDTTGHPSLAYTPRIYNWQAGLIREFTAHCRWNCASVLFMWCGPLPARNFFLSINSHGIHLSVLSFAHILQCVSCVMHAVELLYMFYSIRFSWIV